MTGNTLVPVGSEEPCKYESFDPCSHFTVAYDEAVRLVRTSTGRRFYLHVQQFAPIKDTSGNTNALTQGLLVSTTVNVPKREALGFLDRAYNSDPIKTRSNIRVSFCSNCFFIG